LGDKVTGKNVVTHESRGFPSIIELVKNRLDRTNMIHIDLLSSPLGNNMLWEEKKENHSNINNGFHVVYKVSSEIHSMDFEDVDDEIIKIELVKNKNMLLTSYIDMMSKIV
jgi:hypothetical protein